VTDVIAVHGSDLDGGAVVGGCEVAGNGMVGASIRGGAVPIPICAS
jgi:hypothetical protein